ncbi:uncharacterized protein LOC130686265 isoform X2 [Daphnia carinata]|uniref:uncharacterized protein LOC130686265 isoform X2 n=1 Tax=Daphnia carinata TaxID=120202 RepID=UPI00257E5015|nr:uncharacterized protein LOC130686265 isoform X2 [Daphnia carinata]
MTTQDWTRMLKSFRTKTYRNLATVEDRKAGSALNDARSSSVGLCDDVGEVEDDVDDGICRLGPSDIKSRASNVGAIIKKEISSITGLQQQIKAAFGRWRKRGAPSSHAGLEEEVGGGGHQPIREDSFDHPLNVRLSAQSQTFSHPHRLTVFPPFPSGAASSSSANVSPARTKKSSVFHTSATPSTAAGGGGNSKSGGAASSHPFAFVRGLRKRRAARAGEASEAQSNHQHRTLTDLCSDRLRSRTAAESGWPNCTTRLAGHDHFGPFGPLTAKSRSDHSLHRILKEDNTWTVFATLRPPSDKGGSLSKGTTAWTFGLFSDSTSSHQRRQTSTPSVGKSTKSKAASVAPSPELVHRAFTPCFSAGPPSGLVLPSSGGLFGRNERRTRSLERCWQQRVRGSGAATATATAGASCGYGSAGGQAKAPPPIPSRVRSRSLEKNYTVSTTTSTTPHCNRLAAGAVSNATSGSSAAAANSIGTPLLPVRRNNVPPEVLATWCTFNEAFGGGRPRHQQHQHQHQRLPAEPLTVNDERDSPGSPVFEELFLPPPQKFAAAPLPPPIVANPTVAELVSNNNNNNNKRNSVGAASCCCCSSCSGGHSQSSAGVSCSSKSTPRSSPVPPTSFPETVLYGTREAPVLERHCVEGGEFIIAWLSHSNGSSQLQQPANPSSGGNRVGAAALVSPPTVALTSADMQSSTSSSHSATAATGAHQAAGSGSSSNRSFINKPARGWLHSDVVIVREGITYFVRYIGCLEVNTSMKSLDFDTRSQIAKECINIVCETAGLKTVDKKRKVDRRIQRILGDAPHMEHAGSDVALTISSGCLRISTLEGSAVVACHDMPNISFASGGDPDTLDFVAYVAKDTIHGRACYVLECGGGLAQDVITTIGQAFELRFKEYLKRTPRPAGTESVLDGRDAVGTAGGHNSAGAAPPPWSPDDPEYYNDLPGKVPPDVGPPPVPPLPNYQAPLGGGPVASGTAAGTLKKPSAGHQASSDRSRHTVDLSDNLIDLNADVSSMGRTETGLAGSAGSSGVGNMSGAVVGGNVASLSPFPDHEYVNGIMGSSSDFKNTPVNKDPFDMHPFSATLPSPLPSALLAPNTGTGRPGVTLQRGATKAGKARVSPFEAQLLQEIWFHGPISRKEAEDLLKQDGDFLVRESQGSQGQYVLTGMQSGHHKHLLLVDPEGVVRTKDRTFESVSHLINFHRNNVLPIISAESVLLLKRPVSRAHHT